MKVDDFIQRARANGSITSVQGAANEYAAWKQARADWIEQQEAADAAFVQEMLTAPQPPTSAFDPAKWKQQDYAESARWEREQAYQSYRQGEQAEPQPKPAGSSQSRPWWQRTGDWLQQKVVQPVQQAAGAIVNALKPPASTGTPTPTATPASAPQVSKPWWQRAIENVKTFVQSEAQKFRTWNTIRNDYGWTPIGVFSQQELNMIAETGKDISAYVNTLSPGNGQAWVKSYLPAVITHWTLPPIKGKAGGKTLSFGEKTYSLPFELPAKVDMFGRPMGLPGMVILPHNWGTGYTNPKSMPLAHEFGHVWDARTGNISLQGIVNGVADQLNTFIGGTVVEQNGSRFADGSGKDFIPQEYWYGNDKNSIYEYKTYAQNSTADYLCETFNTLIYSTQTFPKTEVGQWLEIVIKMQADNLGKAANANSTAIAPIPAPTAPSAATPIPSQTPDVGGRQ